MNKMTASNYVGKRIYGVIKQWNTTKLECVSSQDTGSQVCNLLFSKNVNELVSTHGYS